MSHRVGLGTFQFSNVFSPVSDETADAIVRSFIDTGGRYVDTAPKYGLGDVETILGRILADIPRDHYYLATKCGIVWDEDFRLRLSGRYGDVVADCEKSLRRLRVDAIDLYISHAPDPNVPFDETMEAMRDLQQQGKIRDIGVSNVSLSQLEEYNKSGDVKFVQNRFSLLNQSLDDAFHVYCATHDIGITPYMVIERGLLTDKILDGLRIRDNDLRTEMHEFEPARRMVIARWVRDSLKPIADDLGVAVATLAIGWVLHQPNIPFCICGATSVAQVRSNHSAGSMALPPHVLDRVDASYRALEAEIHQDFGTSVTEFVQGPPASADPSALVSRGVRRRADRNGG